MKFWLTLIIGTVGISASLTWLVMHQGAQGRGLVVVAATAPSEPAQMDLEGIEMKANVLEFKPGDSPMNKPMSVEAKFGNSGKGPLKIQLLRASCSCVHEISVNGVVLKPEGEPAVIEPGQKGTIRFGWTPKEDQPVGTVLKISAEFLINDPRPRFRGAPVRMEVTSKVAPAEERKP